MSRWWDIPMLLSAGLFAGGVVSTAWERVRAWRASDLVDFRTGFAHTLRRVDRLQPTLLVVFLGATIGFASSTGTATGGPRSVENQVAWRRPGPHRRRAGLLRPGRRRHRRMSTPTTTGSGMA